MQAGRSAVVDLVAADRQLAARRDQVDGLLPQRGQLLVLAAPGKVDVLGPNRLEVVVRQQRGVLVAYRSALRSSQSAKAAWSCARFAFGRLA